MGKAVSFFFFCFIIVTLAGGVVQGSVPFASTILTADIDFEQEVIIVYSTEGFIKPSIIIIDDERIAYSDLVVEGRIHSIRGTGTQPLIRGAEDTTPSAHSMGARVRTVEGAMLNTTLSYNVALISDASGLWGAITIGLGIMRILGSFLVLPIKFLGTDLAIIGVLWIAMAAGLLISFGLSLAGGRRI